MKLIQGRHEETLHENEHILPNAIETKGIKAQKQSIAKEHI